MTGTRTVDAPRDRTKTGAGTAPRGTVTMVYNTCLHLVKARLPLIAALEGAGYRVAVIAPEDEATDDEEELSDEEPDDEPQTSRSAGSSRYKNIPTWSEAIDLIVDRTARSGSESRGRRGNRSENKNRKRGGRRRRSRKP